MYVRTSLHIILVLLIYISNCCTESMSLKGSLVANGHSEGIEN